ncbi:feruloyl esterase b [Fusarium albosuccineum]|uniref:Carboxylic ester hydrolase n=1 Tax=Fusarium albosuccineum TaxID=1237068 RepID=A0A8H4L7S4_9HYPO|nr:feruloyl esterase b [Fusarium albosuccineum]
MFRNTLLVVLSILAHDVFVTTAVSVHGKDILQKKCVSVDLPKFAEFEVIKVHNVAVFDYIVATTATPTTIDFCHINVTLTHPGANDVVSVSIWLPFDGWNGRFQATGGGGLSAGYFGYALGEPVANGYAAGSTDAGLTLNGTISAATGLWALTLENKLNHGLIKNFAYRSIHDMTVIGKAASKAFYGRSPHHSYYTGCSTGGRQGYFAAQHYPDDFDGIMANAPALFTPRVSPGDFWPYLVMGNAVAPPQCIFSAFQAATIEACDPHDGAVDGLISAPEKCDFDPKTLVGKKIDCPEVGGSVVITHKHATVVAKILQGAHTSTGDFLWYGNPPGAAFDGLANTPIINGNIERVPFSAGEAWMRYFVAQDPDLDTAHMTYRTSEELFSKSVSLFTDILGTDNPDLTRFKKSGGKLLTWHGLADAYITHPGTTRYWDKLQKRMGGAKTIDDFYRVFLAPGVAHCAGGYGPVPVDPLKALVRWVEGGKAPKTLFASGDRDGAKVTRQLCPYPRKLKYKGHGDVNDAESFYCSGSA